MINKADDLHKIEQFVFACENELKEIFIERSNKVYLKLKHILDIFDVHVRRAGLRIRPWTYILV